MDIKKKLSSRENEILVEAVVQRLGPVLKAGNRVTTNFTNRVVALDKKVQQTHSNQINLQLDSQKNNKENYIHLLGKRKTEEKLVKYHENALKNLQQIDSHENNPEIYALTDFIFKRER